MGGKRREGQERAARTHRLYSERTSRCRPEMGRFVAAFTAVDMRENLDRRGVEEGLNGLEADRGRASEIEEAK